jgi:hypothetical protein
MIRMIIGKQFYKLYANLLMFRNNVIKVVYELAFN